MSSPTLEMLLKMPICRGLSMQEASEIYENAQECSTPAGGFVFHEGDKGDALFIVLEGALEITKKDHTGKPLLLAKVGQGGVLGEMTLLNGSTTRSASAQATSPTRLLRLPSSGFAMLLASDCLSALKIVRNLAQLMSRRLLAMDEKLVEAMGHGKKREEFEDFQKILSNWAF